MAHSENVKIKCSLKEVPFKTSLSFEHLIELIKEISLLDSHPMNSMAVETMAKLDMVPELKGNDIDETILEENQTIVNQIMGFAFNPVNDTFDLAAAFPPFNTLPFFTTHHFNETIGGEHHEIEIAKKTVGKTQLIMHIYHAYFIIFEKIYGIKTSVDKMPNTLKVTNKLDKSIYYYNATINTQYLQVKPKGKYEKLSEEEIKQLIERESDLDFWYQKIPLDRFEFSGFLKFNFYNVTYDYLMSQLKSDLLDKNTIVSKEGFKRIREKVSVLIENPDVEFGLAAVHDFELGLDKNFIWKTIIPLSKLKCDNYIGSIYEKAFQEKKIVLTEDFSTIKKDKLIEAFLEKGIRNHAVVPLIFEDEIVGMIEFGSKTPNAMSLLKIKKLYELFPIFAIALNQSKEEWNDKVRAIIQEEFTAIHPTVEWRFREAVADLINKNPEKESFIVEPIVFSDIIPIYGSSDIRGSSLERNKAIKSDIMEQLQLADELMETISNQKDIPLLNDLAYKIRKHLQTVESGLKAGDEISIMDFLKNDIDPVLLLVKDRYSEMQKPVDEYFQKLDVELGVLYKKRKNFEESVTLINDKVSEVIDKEQVKAQQFFPHYFEKYRSDGVEYNGYIGQSLVKNLKYNDVYLKNIRLWQLLTKVKIARNIRKLQSSLPTKLDIAQLVLVHSNPLSIAFRQDEKKFDVAGAYNIRYEITKKRIDKAMIKGTNERITQVGKIAIIYSYATEIEEYKQYIEYMIAQGYLKDSMEDFELEDLTGASGLRGLRIEVSFDEPLPNKVNNKAVSADSSEK